MRKHKSKRKKDHVWEFVKFTGDAAIYAKCSCGFTYSCWKNVSENALTIEPAPERLYPYCPFCGSHKTLYSTKVVRLDHKSITNS